MPKSSGLFAPPVPTVRVRLPTDREFWAFATQIPIASRDTGLGPITPWGTQRELLRQMLQGLEEGAHQFLINKAGQVGSSTASQLTMAYWLSHYPGLQGVVVANADDVRDFFRDTVTQMMGQALPTEPPRINNKMLLAWPNGGRVIFQTAGARSGSRVSVGRGFAFCLGTEVALWQNPQALTILRTRFSDVHPARLSLFESTPRGRNWWWDVWQEAAEAKDIRRIELFWWMREDYALDRCSEAFRQYWTGVLRPRERRWAKEIARRFRRQLTPEQWAWRRWYVAEKAGGDERTADQEMATVTEDGFEATGLSFLALDALRRVRHTVNASPAPNRWRYEFGRDLEATQVKRTIPGYGTLAVWQEPEDAEGYVVAAVPAFSATVECPDHVASVWRASREDLEQVAEFGDPDCGMQAFSWVCAHLAGSYAVKRRAFILETAGMGMGVLQELQRLQTSGWGTTRRPQLNDLLGGVKHYIWRRPDSLAGGAALQWRTSPEFRLWLLNRLRDQLASGRVLVRSEALLDELERVRQVGDEFVAQGREVRDHRVVAAALAVEAWAKQLLPLFRRIQGGSLATTVTEQMIGNFFRRLGAVPTGSAR